MRTSRVCERVQGRRRKGPKLARLRASASERVFEQPRRQTRPRKRGAERQSSLQFKKRGPKRESVAILTPDNNSGRRHRRLGRIRRARRTPGACIMNVLLPTLDPLGGWRSCVRSRQCTDASWAAV